MRILLTLAFLLAFSASAVAQNNTITVVNPDGTKSSIDVGPSPIEPAQQSVLRSRTVDGGSAPVVKPAKKAEIKPAKKPVPAKQAAKKDTPVKKKKTAAPAPKKPVQKTAQKKAAPAAPLATRAPAKPVPAPAPSSPQNLGTNMTSDDAIRIALDAAPPARSVHAFPVNYKGTHAFQVVFATEDGERSLFVDRETGKLVR